MEIVSHEDSSIDLNPVVDASSYVVGERVVDIQTPAAAIRKSLSGKIIIRTPEPDDREAARELTRAAHAQTVFGDIPFSDKKYDQLADRVLARPRNAVVLLAELDGKIIGLAWATAGEYILGEGVFCTTAHAIVIDQQTLSQLRRAKCFLRLIKGLRTWSKTRNAERIIVHVTTGQKLVATDRLLRAAGMQMVGGGYVVKLRTLRSGKYI